MFKQPFPASLAFSLGPYRLACALEHGQLTLRVAANETRPHQLALARLANVGGELELVVSAALTNQQVTQYPEASLKTEEERMLERVSVLENYVTDLQRKLDGQGRSRRELKYSGPSERRNSRASLRQRAQGTSSGSIRQREDHQISGIIQKQVEQNLKLELLNDILQEKLLKREGDLLDLERSLLQREDLIRELAEKLITANIEKEDIFNEYDKILQTIVFHQEERQKQHKLPLETAHSLEEIEVKEGSVVEGQAQAETQSIERGDSPIAARSNEQIFE